MRWLFYQHKVEISHCFCLKQAKEANLDRPTNAYYKKKYFAKRIFVQNTTKNSDCPPKFALFSGADYSAIKFRHFTLLKICQKYTFLATNFIFTLN